jgi:DNA-binding transcriptional LysR family regulator
MDRLAAYDMFVQVARSGSFSGAARRLGLAPQAITRGIAGLEEHLGIRLFQRSTRAVALTAEGAGLLPRSAAGMLVEPQGELAITAPVAFGQRHVVPVVSELLSLHPGLDVRLMLIDRNVRLIEEGIDVAVRIGALEDSALRARRIGAVREVIVGSPAYLARQGVPARGEDLGSHELIASTGPRGGREWRIVGVSSRTGPRRRLRINSVDGAIAAAEAGVGLANFLSYQVADALAAGRLVEVLRPEPVEPIPVNLVFDPARATSAGTRAFIEAMVRRASRGGWG